MRHNSVRQWPRPFGIVSGGRRVNRLFTHQNSDTGALWIIILPRHVQDIGADNIHHFTQNIGQPIGIILLINVRNIFLTVLFSLRITNVVKTET